MKFVKDKCMRGVHIQIQYLHLDRAERQYGFIFILLLKMIVIFDRTRVE